jgi:uncharacterized alpha-E superfamily protein
MLSRVADSLYWMSRYFERADHCARVIEANYNLMLNPSKISTELRLTRIMASLGASLEPGVYELQAVMQRLTSDATNRSSIRSCIVSARENASQVREQITSEMWECINALYHEVTQSSLDNSADPFDPLVLVTAVREGSYRFTGVTEATMNHDEGWQFIQFGRFMERATAVSLLLGVQFSVDNVEDLDWVGLLSSFSAFEAYCKVYTADLRPDLIAEFLLLNPEFPYAVRHAAERMDCALEAIAESISLRKAARVERIIGQLHSSLAYTQIGDIMSRDFHKFLNEVLAHCRELHAAVHELYISYPIESAFEA